MPMWRCPHCGTPQAETARCWVCRRSSTTCSTCRHFRRSVAAQLGYCGLDRRRVPLAGTELRGCWDAAPLRLADAGPELVRGHEDAAEPASPALRLRDFVPVELARRQVPSARRARPPRAAEPAATEGATTERPEPGPAPEIEAIPRWADRVTLFADVEL